MQDIENYPLQWPQWQKRTEKPAPARFGEHTIAAARDEVFRQIALLKGKEDPTHQYITISSNVATKSDGMLRSNFRKPDDCGVAVYFELKNKPLCLACDAWDDVGHNLWAIACHIDAMRGQRRWGVGSIEQAFAGYQALPDYTKKKPWWEVLGSSKDDNIKTIREKFRDLAILHHPDKGGDRAKWDEIEEAYREGLKAQK